MLVTIGLIVPVVALIVGIVGLLSNAGPPHPLTENFSVFGYQPTGPTRPARSDPVAPIPSRGVTRSPFRD